MKENEKEFQESIKEGTRLRKEILEVVRGADPDKLSCNQVVDLMLLICCEIAYQKAPSSMEAEHALWTSLSLCIVGRNTNLLETLKARV